MGGSAMKIRWLLLPLLLVVWSGCASYQANVAPGTQIVAYQRWWVKTNLNDNNGLDRLIVAVLQSHGFAAECGPLTLKPDNVHVVVSYRDRWSWDFKKHMTSLELFVEDTRQIEPVATAVYSGPASLNLSPREVVERLVKEMLEKKSRAPETAAPSYGANL